MLGRTALIINVAAWGTLSAAQEIAVPSGHLVTVLDTRIVTGAQGETLHLRVLMPQIDRQGDAVSYDEVAGDFAALCDGLGIPVIDKAGVDPDAITVTLLSAEAPFGQTTPGITKFSESFGVEAGRCIWEAL